MVTAYVAISGGLILWLALRYADALDQIHLLEVKLSARETVITELVEQHSECVS
jgi:hypothetical protein